ncbi:MAG TPA: gamma-glutamyl-gamma-aminobutyrate hydrolase family protein [Candidatus Sulfotelmatobacter sp.]|nr:gamma-glutamyl-gamma-aminobutyrate hydrolase family protein [Candidatus Sulfotelmatobacter sp.]
MPPRIAIPIPHSFDEDYAKRAIPQYERAVELAGGEAVRIPLDQTAAEVIRMIERCDGVLLPGSKADVDPARFKAARSPRTADADPRRDAVDDLLLEDAYKLRKPVLGICYGLQSLNVFRAGSLVQHIPDFLPAETRATVDHAVGKKAAVAHTVEIEASSKLGQIVADALESTSESEAHTDDKRQIAALKALRRPRSTLRRLFSRVATPADHQSAFVDGDRVIVPVNSSHHQSAEVTGDGLCIAARCPDDGILEALEGTAPEHFVLAVQWHPERSVEDDEASLAIFRALVNAAAEWRR